MDEEREHVWSELQQHYPFLRELFRRVVQGESVTGLARELNQRGIRTTTGNTWAVARVRELVRSPQVAGIHVYQR